MPLSPGDKLGPYEILSPLGKGGMGEVWKARDPRLDRIVAVKTSSAKFSERFEREARAIAALNHPNICQIYDVGPDYLVMEYVEGSEIKGPLPLDQALKAAIQLAAALEAAHRKSITHRDLKPANILTTKSGIKVLDFGLAKFEVVQTTASEETMTRALTQEGTIVGTLQYMAPEQLQGQPADSRADIFSFGCVLYELLTGKRAFEGASAATIIAAILERPAPTVGGVVPASLDWVLHLCLAKDPDQRWQSMRDVRAALERVAEAGVEAASQPSASASRAPWMVAAACALAAIAAGALYLRGSGSTAAPELRLDIATPPTVAPASLALSPDGRHIAYVATVDGVSRLWVRALNSTAATPVSGSEDALNPFWSADGRSIGFVSGVTVKTIDLGGGQAQVIASVAPLAAEASWNSNNQILLASSGFTLTTVGLTGKPPVEAAKLSEGQMVHRAPRFLPDGKQFLFFSNGTEAALWLGSLAGTSPRRITAVSPGPDSAAEYLEPGWLVRVQNNTLVAQPFDASRGQFKGEPVTLAAGVGVDSNSERGAFSVSASGTIAWRGGEPAHRQLIWFDRSGRNVGTLGPPDPLVLNPEISPDNQRVLVTRGRLELADIWIQDGPRGTRFTSDPADDRLAIWSPDGKEVVFASNRNFGSEPGNLDLYRKPASGLGSEELLLHTKAAKLPNSWSPDGRYLLYCSLENKGDLMVLPLTGDRKPYPFVRTQFSEDEGIFSPDGKWVAYESDESGRSEVYVRPFPGPGTAFPISTGGGANPRWSRDRKELYFVAPDSMLMAAPVTARGAAFVAGTPQPLFRSHIIPAFGRQQYDVSRDGRFLILTELEVPAEPIHILLNWKRP
jgi:eukaryotic-like serine/threonine-protein kinase